MKTKRTNKQKHVDVKRRKLENQLREGILSPPKLTEKVVPWHGKIDFVVPSTQNSLEFGLAKFQRISDTGSGIGPKVPGTLVPGPLVPGTLVQESAIIPNTMIDNNLSNPVSEKKYCVTIRTKDDKNNLNKNTMIYSCTCKNDLVSYGICKHIRSVIIYMMLDIVKKQNDTDDMNFLIDALEKYNMENCT
jgi:hypothetical protein